MLPFFRTHRYTFEFSTSDDRGTAHHRHRSKRCDGDRRTAAEVATDAPQVYSVTIANGRKCSRRCRPAAFRRGPAATVTTDGWVGQNKNRCDCSVAAAGDDDDDDRGGAMTTSARNSWIFSLPYIDRDVTGQYGLGTNFHKREPLREGHLNFVSKNYPNPGVRCDGPYFR